jgi:nucleotide-binding universal stress UspA family protein
MTRQIVVGVDGSPAAERALVWAADAASRDDAQLLIAHGGDVLPKAELALDGGRDYSRELLRDAVATAIDVGGTCNVSTALRQQSPAELLLELSDDARMVVVGTHGAGRIVGALLGSVAYRVAAHARCPVVVVPERWRAPAAGEARAVAVGVSGSVSGGDALEFAFDEAERAGVPLVAVRSWTGHDSTRRDVDLVTNGNDRLRHEQQGLLTGIVEAAWARHPTVEVVTELSSEPVYDALLAAATRAGLLVLGCRHADDHLFSRLGPIASRLLHTSPCPVAVVGHPVAPTTPAPVADDHAYEELLK